MSHDIPRLTFQKKLEWIEHNSSHDLYIAIVITKSFLLSLLLLLLLLLSELILLSSFLLLILLLLLLSEVFIPKDQPIKAGRYFNPAFKWCYTLHCLTGHVFKGVQWDYVSNMKMMSRNTSSHLSPSYPNFCKES